MTNSVSHPLLFVSLALILAACTERDVPATARDTSVQRADTPRLIRIQPPILPADLRGITLALPDIDTILALTGRGPITLADTLFNDTAAAVEVTLLPSLLASSQPGPEGHRRAVVPVLVETGGSGVFVHLLAFERGEAGLRQTGETFLGDRVGITSVSLRGDTAVLALTVHDIGDARCCPTLKVERRYVLSGGVPQLLASDTVRAVDTARAVVADSSAKPGPGKRH